MQMTIEQKLQRACALVDYARQDRKKAEEALRRAREAELRAAEQYRVIVQEATHRSEHA